MQPEQRGPSNYSNFNTNEPLPPSGRSRAMFYLASAATAGTLAYLIYDNWNRPVGAPGLSSPARGVTQRVNERSHEITDTTPRLVEKAKVAAEAAKETAKDALEDMKDSASGLFETSREKTRDLSQVATDKMAGMKEKILDKMEQMTSLHPNTPTSSPPVFRGGVGAEDQVGKTSAQVGADRLKATARSLALDTGLRSPNEEEVRRALSAGDPASTQRYAPSLDELERKRAHEAAQDLKRSATSAAQDAKDKAQATAHVMKDKAQEKAHVAAKRTEEAAHSVKERAHEAVDWTKEKVREAKEEVKAKAHNAAHVVEEVKDSVVEKAKNLMPKELDRDVKRHGERSAERLNEKVHDTFSPTSDRSRAVREDIAQGAAAARDNAKMAVYDMVDRGVPQNSPADDMKALKENVKQTASNVAYDVNRRSAPNAISDTHTGDRQREIEKELLLPGIPTALIGTGMADFDRAERSGVSGRADGQPSASA